MDARAHCFMSLDCVEEFEKGERRASHVYADILLNTVADHKKKTNA